MAKGGTIESKLQLNGEKEYQNALDKATNSLGVLKSALKAETAELGRNASAQDKAKVKITNLQKQIKVQEQTVKTLEKALADSRKEYAENQDVQDKWEKKLNDARAALANMKNELGTCEDGLAKFSGAMQDVASSSGQAMQTVVSFNDAMKSIGSIASGIGNSLSGIFEATVDTMQDMVNEMFSLMSQAWAAAGDWKDIQAVWGGSLEEIEKVFTGMKLQGVDTSLITGGLQKLVSNTHSGNKETKAALKQLHIQEKDYTNHWDYFMAVMQALETRKGADREKLIRDIFGDTKGSGMMLVMDNWLDAMNKYEKDVEETGLKLTSPEIEALDEVAHKITEIQEMWNTIKTNIGAKLSEVLNMDTLAEDALEVLRTFAALMNSDEESKAELTIKLSDSIEKLITDISTSIGNLSTFLKEFGKNLEESSDPLLQFIGKLSTSLGEFLDWLSENSGTIIEWLNRLLPVMMANKVTEAVTGKGIGDWITDILKLGLDVTIMGKAFGSSAGAAIGATATTFGSGIGAALIAKFPLLGKLLGGAAGTSGTVATAGAAAAAAAPGVVDLANAGVNLTAATGMALPAYGDWFTHNTNTGRWLTGQQTGEATSRIFRNWFEETTSEKNLADFAANWDLHGENANPLAKGTGKVIDFVTEQADLLKEQAGSIISSIFGEGTGEAAVKGWDNLIENSSKKLEAKGKLLTLGADKVSEALALPGLWEFVKEKVLDENRPGLEILDPATAVENAKAILNTPQERNQKTMGFILSSLFGGGPKAEEVLEPKSEPDVWEVPEKETIGISPWQLDAAQRFWDLFREDPWSVTDEQYEEFAAAFEGTEDVFEALSQKMDELTTSVQDSSWQQIEDLPSDWFTVIYGSLKNLNKDNYKGSDDENLPDRIGAAVAGAVKGAPITVTVIVDGETITKTVDQRLGGQLSRLFS